VPASSSSPSTDPITLVYSKFESGLDGWGPFGNSHLDPQIGGCYAGNGCVISTNRTMAFEGPAYQLLALAHPGKIHEVSGWVKILPGPAVAAADAGADAALEVPEVVPQAMSITLATQCSGESFIYTTVDQAVVGDTWVKLSGNFVADTCELENLYVYFEKPTAGTEFLFDEAKVIAMP